MDSGKRLLEELEFTGTPLSGYEFVAHTTRSSTFLKPRVRLFAPTTRHVMADEFPLINRIFAWVLDDGKIEQTDLVSFRPAQIMYKPSISRDQVDDYWHLRNEGKLVDPDALIALYAKRTGLDPHAIENWPRRDDEHELRLAAKKAEDPTTKTGIIGTFCRMFSVMEAITEFELPYDPSGDDSSGKMRYSFRDGTTADGVEVQDDGLFIYSHHGSDPCGDKLCNAYDMTRIHLHGHLDTEEDLKDLQPGQWASAKAFNKELMLRPDFKRAMTADKYDIAGMYEGLDLGDGDDEEDDEPEEAPAPRAPDNEDDAETDALDDITAKFGSVMDADEPRARDQSEGAGDPEVSAPSKTPKGKRPKAPKAPDADTWFPQTLETDQSGNIKPIPTNAATILSNDARTHGRIALNEFNRQIVLRYDFKSNIPIVPSRKVRDYQNGDRWQDVDDVILRMMLGTANDPTNGFYGYGIQLTDRDLNAAVIASAYKQAFHPIRDYLRSLTWDGVPRIDTLFVDYFGVPDTAYHRETARLMLLASVTRAEEPGHKFDNTAIIEGEQGLRKSSFIKALYSKSWFGEIDCDLGNAQAVAETIGGIWGGELPEVTSFHKSDFNAAKAFMRRTTDRVRMAYDRRMTEFDRQIVLWGTTNDQKYLKDPTGNRSYWPIRMRMGAAKFFAMVAGKRQIDTDRIEQLRDQLWAEAHAVYTEMRAKHRHGDLPLYLSTDADREAVRLQEGARVADLHETWAEVVQDWLDEPVPLSQYLAEAGLPPEDQFAEGGETGATVPMVLRCAVTREIILAGALHKDRGIQDYQTNSNFAKTMPMITGWARAISTGSDGQNAGQRGRVQGVLRRWIYREGITAEEKKLGYRLLPDGDNSPDDEIDGLI